MHIILCGFGTAGDTLPMIAVSAELRRRGHDVVLLGLDAFAAAAAAAGVEFHPIGPAGLFEEFSSSPATWHSITGFSALWRMIERTIEDTLGTVRRLRRGQATVLAGTSGALGLRLAQEMDGHRLATIHTAPFFVFSRHDNCLGGLRLPEATPPWLRNGIYALIDRLFIDGVSRDSFNALRARLGLPPVKGVFTKWVNSPDRVLLATPEWFAASQPDWPESLVRTPFPILPDDAHWAPPAELAAFLAGGPAPVVFTLSTGVGSGHDFFARALEVGERTGRRLLLVSRSSAQIPARLPDTAFHLDHAPFGSLLPLASAMVHQGGIGATSQALRAGLPQVVVPYAYDQFHNGISLERLGVGASVDRDAPARKLAAALDGVMGDARVVARCAELRERMRWEPSGVACMATHIELLGRR